MTPTQINIAIAEACGLGLDSSDGPYTSLTEALEKSYNTLSDYGIPDYYSDLNAMHEAEMTLTPEQLVDYCNFRLRFVTGEGSAADYKMICATATQRAEAFLRTIGKWKE